MARIKCYFLPITPHYSNVSQHHYWPSCVFFSHRQFSFWLHQTLIISEDPFFQAGISASATALIETHSGRTLSTLGLWDAEKLRLFQPLDENWLAPFVLQGLPNGFSAFIKQLQSLWSLRLDLSLSLLLLELKLIISNKEYLFWRLSKANKSRLKMHSSR